MGTLIHIMGTINLIIGGACLFILAECIRDRKPISESLLAASLNIGAGIWGLWVLAT